MRLFWLIIGVFMIFAAFVAWARIDTPGKAGPPSPDSPAPIAEMQGEVDAGDAPLNMIDELSREARKRAEVDEAQQLADELFASAAQRGAAGGSPPPGTPPPAGQHQPGPVKEAENPWKDGAADGGRLEHSVREQPDGAVVLDETFEIKGKGTAAEPYEITWDLLLSAAETYQPRLGMRELPERITMLDGKHVKISGYLLFPMIGADAKEVLVMLNMWDGCCIGTMPSPYDAIEVQLAEPVRASTRSFMNYGAIEGRLTIDPYLVNDWLLGLYVMENATLQVGM